MVEGDENMGEGDAMVEGDENMGEGDEKMGEGHAKVTKLKKTNTHEVDAFSAEDRDEFLKIYQKPRLNEEGKIMEYGIFRILRILANKKVPEEIFTKSFQVTQHTQDKLIVVIFYTKEEKQPYRIKVLPGSSLYTFFKQYNTSNFRSPGLDGRERIKQQQDAEQKRLRRIVKIPPDAYKRRDDMRKGMFKVNGKSDLPNL